MAKGNVLGNDPFQRGAAERPKSAEAAEAPVPAPSPKQEAHAPVAKKKAEGVVKSARAAPAMKPSPTPAPKKKAAKRAAPPPALKPPVVEKKQKPAPAPKPVAAKPPPPAEPVRAPTPPAPRREEQGPSRPSVVETVVAEEVEEVVHQGELVDEIPRPRTPLVAERRAQEREEDEEDEDRPDPRPPGFFASLRAQAIRAAESALETVLNTRTGQRAVESLGQSELAQKILGRAANAAMSAAPAVRAAMKALPPAVDAARSAIGAIASGEAAKDFIATAAEAGDAARRVMNRVEPAPIEVDLFGEDPTMLSRSEPIFDFLHERYFRVETLGAENVPEGGCLLVCNHSGALPIDGPMLRTVLRKDCKRQDARWLVEDAIFHAPFMGVYLNRLGAVRACPENAERLLSEKVPLVVFPEGLLGISKRIGERYRLQRFGRGGFVKLALRSGVPIIPVAIVGAEEATPLVAKIPMKALGVPYLPVTPTFPLLGPIGLLPLPTKWTISFLKPVDVKRHGPEAADDHALVAGYTAEVRDAIQDELNRLVDARGSLFGG